MSTHEVNSPTCESLIEHSSENEPSSPAQPSLSPISSVDVQKEKKCLCTETDKVFKKLMIIFNFFQRV